VPEKGHNQMMSYSWDRLAVRDLDIGQQEPQTTLQERLSGDRSAKQPSAATKVVDSHEPSTLGELVLATREWNLFLSTDMGVQQSALIWSEYLTRVVRLAAFLRLTAIVND